MLSIHLNVYVFLVSVFIVACLVWIRSLRSKNVARLPGPVSLVWLVNSKTMTYEKCRNIASWIWGHELLVFQHDATHMYSMWACVFGPIFKIKAALFHPDIVRVPGSSSPIVGTQCELQIVATDHAAVRHIFANTDIYGHSRSQSRFDL
jgi:hypothetical protein